jgi:hypothetical protein
MSLADTDREARILELKRLVQTGEYKVAAQQIAAKMVDDHLVEKPSHKPRTKLKSGNPG